MTDISKIYVVNKGQRQTLHTWEELLSTAFSLSA